MTPVRVLIVDDSVIARGMLGEIVAQSPSLQVAGYARDGLHAASMLGTLRPDVVTLDLEMPRMDGLAFLERVLPVNPVPVVVVSSISRPGCEMTLRALGLGAVDFVTKPTGYAPGEFGRYEATVTEKILAAATANPAVIRGAAAVAPPAGPRLPDERTAGRAALVAIGASAGGPRALRDLFAALPAYLPPIVVAQHMPGSFTGPFAARLDTAGAVRVCEVDDGTVLRPGHAYLAPGGTHLRVERNRGHLLARIDRQDRSAQHRPSVDVLFDSAARAAGEACLAAVLTGMGDDGVAGAKAVRAAGGRVVVQDESTSAIYGMPRAVACALVPDAVLPLPRIAQYLVAWSAAGSGEHGRPDDEA